MSYVEVGCWVAGAIAAIVFISWLVKPKIVFRHEWSKTETPSTKKPPLNMGYEAHPWANMNYAYKMTKMESSSDTTAPESPKKKKKKKKKPESKPEPDHGDGSRWDEI